MNLNMQAFNINTLLGGLDKVRDVMGVYQQQLLLIVIVFALLNCFFGYALRKLWSVIRPLPDRTLSSDLRTRRLLPLASRQSKRHHRLWARRPCRFCDRPDLRSV